MEFGLGMIGMSNWEDPKMVEKADKNFHSCMKAQLNISSKFSQNTDLKHS